MPSTPIAYAMGPARGRRYVSKRGHVNRTGKGRTGPGYAWASRGELDVRKPRRMVPTLVSFPERLVCPGLLTCLQLRADGGTLGPRGGNQPIFETQFLNSNEGEEGIGHFRCTNPPFQIQEILAPDSPSRKAIVKASHQGASGKLISGVSPGFEATRAGLVSGRAGTSESESLLNLGGPRRYIGWRDLYNRRLDDDLHDGAVSVLSIADFRTSTEISRIKSPWQGRPRCSWGRVLESAAD